MAGIKETKELLAGLKALKGIIEAELKDGFQNQDIADMIAQASENEAIKLAIAGIDQVLPEMKDLDWSEKFSLALELVKVAF